MITKLLAILSIVTWLAGCATGASPPEVPTEYCTVAYTAQSPEIRKVALVTSPEPPVIEPVSLGYTRGEGAGGGAAAGAAGGAGLGADAFLHSSDPYAALFGVLLMPVLMVGGAVGGAVVGAATGHAPDSLAEAEANAQAMLNSAYLQEEVLQKAKNYGVANLDLEFIRLPDNSPEPPAANRVYKGLADQSIDAVLEIELHRISLKNAPESGGISSGSALEMEARSRLVFSQTGDVIVENKHAFRSEYRSLDDWTGNEATQLRESIQWGVTVLAEDIVDEGFSRFSGKWRRYQLAADDPGDSADPNMELKRIFSLRHLGKPGTEFSPDLLDIPEGKSAIFIYRPASGFATLYSVPVLFNSRYLSRLPQDGFECLVVEPGMNTLSYPAQLIVNGPGAENVPIIREPVEMRSNEIVYFVLEVARLSSDPAISGESVDARQAVGSLRGKRRAGIRIIGRH